MMLIEIDGTMYWFTGNTWSDNIEGCGDSKTFYLDFEE